MTTCKIIFLFPVLFFQILFVFSQENKIQIPPFNDKYSKYVEQLESGKTDIDYTDFRNSFLESKQYNKKGENFENLKKQLEVAVKSQNFKQVIILTKAMLSIDYTSMFLHMYLEKAYARLDDTLNRDKYYTIEHNLINSIMKSGDGLTCETAWHVTQVEEEYFIAEAILKAEVQGQMVVNTKKNECDKVGVKTKSGELKTYFFEANKMVELENKKSAK